MWLLTRMKQTIVAEIETKLSMWHIPSECCVLPSGINYNFDLILYVLIDLYGVDEYEWCVKVSTEYH